VSASIEITLLQAQSTLELVPTGPQPLELCHPPLTTIEVALAAMGQPGAPGAPGLPGPPGSEIVTRPAAGTVNGHRVVALRSDDTLEYADRTATNALNVFGVSITAASDGDPVTVVFSGLVQWPSAAFVAGERQYLGLDGFLTNTMPVAGVVRQIGVALTPDRLFVDIGPIYIA
jgi:hypothetical protein